MDTRTYKILLVGDIGVGKTTYIERLASGQFHENYVHTEDVKVNSLSFYTNKGQVSMEICEPGNSDFPKDIDGCIIMFDVTNRQSYDNLDTWYSKVQSLNITTILCGNKIDKKDKVMKSKMIKFHREKDMTYY